MGYMGPRYQGEPFFRRALALATDACCAMTFLRRSTSSSSELDWDMAAARGPEKRAARATGQYVGHGNQEELPPSPLSSRHHHSPNTTEWC